MSTRFKRQTTWQRRGASIPNVLGATTAILLLAVYLLPALASVRKSSKNGTCLTNLMQIGFANMIYASQDPGDMALPVHPMHAQCVAPNQSTGSCSHRNYVGAYEWGGKSGIGRTDNLLFPGSSDPLDSKYGTKAGFGPATRPLNSILYPQDFPDHGGVRPGDPLQFEPLNEVGAFADTKLDLSKNRCPSDTGFTGAHCQDFAEKGLSSYDHFGTSYNANMFMTSGGAGPEYSNSPYLHRMSDILSPSTTLAYQENNGRFAWAVEPDPCAILPIRGIPGPVRGWHGKDWTFNATFIDGHADTIYMRGYKNPNPGPGDFWGFQCIIVRGEGWQIDTLPLPRVPTQLISNGSGRPSYQDCVFPGPPGRESNAPSMGETKGQAAGKLSRTAR